MSSPESPIHTTPTASTSTTYSNTRAYPENTALSEEGQLPVRTKRRYGASCELCRKRKRKCPGRDKNGNSLCTHCAEVGVECIFPPNGQTTRARRAMAAANAASEVDKLKDYIRHLASTGPSERDRLLSQWVSDDIDGPPDSFSASTSLHLRIPSEETKYYPAPNAVAKHLATSSSTSVKSTLEPFEADQQRPIKRRKLSVSSPSSLHDTHIHSLAPDDNQRDSDDPDPESELSWRPESALRLSLHPLNFKPNLDSRESTRSRSRSRSRIEGVRGTGPLKKDGRGLDDGQSTDEDDEDEDVAPGYHSTLDSNFSSNQNARRKGHSGVFANGGVKTNEVKGQDMAESIPHQRVATQVDGYINSLRISVDDITAEDRELLLKNYFCWQGPRNSVVDQALFERSMKENDPRYFTPFLFYSVCAHTCRHVPQLKERVFEYAAKALTLLPMELCRPSSIPTIQGLLLISSHFAARGMYGQSWNLTGLAVAMMTDIGCHLEQSISESQSHSSSAKTLHEMRIRVFWAVFVWDKIISLALNRPAHLSYEHRFPPYPEPKETSKLWVPLISIDSPPALFSYQPQPTHVEKCFYESCRAYHLLDKIHYHLYQRHRSMNLTEIKEFVSEMRNEVLTWQESSCREVILLDVRSPMVNPPPPHILQLNLVVRVMWILLFRPFYYRTTTKQAGSSNVAGLTTLSSRPSSSRPSSAPKSATTVSSSSAHKATSTDSSNNLPSIPHAITTCEQAAVEINVLFLMYDQLCPISRASYIIIFAAFLAATIDLALADKQRVAVASAVSASDTVGTDGGDDERGDVGVTEKRKDKKDRRSIQKLQSELGVTLGRLALANRVLGNASAVVPGMNASVAKLRMHMKMMLEGSKIWTEDLRLIQGRRVEAGAAGQPSVVAVAGEREKLKRIWEDSNAEGHHHGQSQGKQEQQHRLSQQQKQHLSGDMDSGYTAQVMSKTPNYSVQPLSGSSYADSSMRYEPVPTSGYEYQQQQQQHQSQAHSRSGHGMVYHDSTAYANNTTSAVASPTSAGGYHPSTSSAASTPTSAYDHQQQLQVPRSSHPSASHISSQSVVLPHQPSSSYHAHIPSAHVSPDPSPITGDRYEYVEYHAGVASSAMATTYGEPAAASYSAQHTQSLQHHPHSYNLQVPAAQIPQHQQPPPPYQQNLEPTVAMESFSDLRGMQGLNQQASQMQPGYQWQNMMMNGTGMEDWNPWFWPGDGVFGTDDSWYNSNLATRTVV
ncbi:hypothetical protein K435DRAFT_755645 [Dendrothele bispora CBS 962.96]|uniref:Zn(2)-C6 fungal-type domain-containing protein n=1 Tax=Dendrothele bispora (strain CBS 962.96) TaxID=1314807 RepID=A0A4S8M0C6_DENBC|nr:hypothetical protein K435DRAFT_755645 [Dendrothele bispora CBS 962.96]